MKPNGSIHYAKLQNSKRLRDLLAFLADGKPHTTFEIIMGTGICAVNSAVCELRLNGYAIDCRLVKGKGEAVWEYQLTGAVKRAA